MLNITPDTKEILHFELYHQVTWIKTLVFSVVLGTRMSWKILRICPLYSISPNSHALSAQNSIMVPQSHTLFLCSLSLSSCQPSRNSLCFFSLSSVFHPFPSTNTLTKILQIGPFVSTATTLGQKSLTACLNYC